MWMRNLLFYFSVQSKYIWNLWIYIHGNLNLDKRPTVIYIVMGTLIISGFVLQPTTWLYRLPIWPPKNCQTRIRWRKKEQVFIYSCSFLFPLPAAQRNSYCFRLVNGPGMRCGQRSKEQTKTQGFLPPRLLNGFSSFSSLFFFNNLISMGEKKGKTNFLF